MARISWDEYFMSMAELASKRSTCLRRHVGAVIVRDNQVLSTGYNGAPKGLPNCCDLNECLRQKLGIPSGRKTRALSCCSRRGPMQLLNVL